MNLAKVKWDLAKRWPLKANSLEEATAIYVIHYLTGLERIHFANELFRVLKVGGRCEIHTPHWCSSKAFADPLAPYPPVSEWWYPMLNKTWREQQERKVMGYKCNFDAGIGYGMHPAIVTRNQEYQQNAMMFYKEAAQDLIVTLTKL